MYKKWPDQEGLVKDPDSYRENAKPDLQSLCGTFLIHFLFRNITFTQKRIRFTDHFAQR